MISCNVVVPQLFWFKRCRRSVLVLFIASLLVNVGMWFERFNIVVPTSQHPRMEMSLTHYLPSWIEVSIMAGTFAGFILTYMVATKFFPIISLWEIREGREQSVREVSERVTGYLPDKVEAANP